MCYECSTWMPGLLHIYIHCTHRIKCPNSPPTNNVLEEIFFQFEMMRTDSRTVEWMNSVSGTLDSIGSDDVELKTTFCACCVTDSQRLRVTSRSRTTQEPVLGLFSSNSCGLCPFADFVKSQIPIHATKAYGCSRSIAPVILKLGARWRWVVNFTTWPLYHWISWLCPKTCLDVLEKKNHYCRLSGFKFRTFLGNKPIRLLCLLLRKQK
jgi:hypothetical protein